MNRGQRLGKKGHSCPRQELLQTVAAGWDHCALTSGEVWCWGGNNYGQLAGATTSMGI